MGLSVTLRGVEHDFEFVTPETVPGISVMQFAYVLFVAGYYNQNDESEPNPEVWNTDLANAFNRWWDEVILGDAYGPAYPDSNYPEVYVSPDRSAVAILGRVTKPDGTVGEEVMDLLVSFAGLDTQAYDWVQQIPYEPAAAPTEAPPEMLAPAAPLPPKPPSPIARASMVPGLVGLGVLAGIGVIVALTSSSSHARR